MVSDLFFYEMLLLGLLWLCVLLPCAWPAADQRTPRSARPPRKRSRGPKPFAGLIHKPSCPVCEPQGQSPPPSPPGAPPPGIVHPRGCPRQVDPSAQVCPTPDCTYYGWVGFGNLQANGHPGGGLWRQWHCIQCDAYVVETSGTPFHGKRISPALLVGAVGALAAGVGIRAVARVFAVDPTTVLAWWVDTAEHLKACSQPFLHDVHVPQVQLDELYALLRAVKAGEISEARAITRLSRSPHWVWVAIDPGRKLLLAIDVGARTLARAQCLVPQVVGILAPGCGPVFLTDGFKESTPALLTHGGHWVQPARRQGRGPMPKPRWLPLPQVLYAQVIKTTRQRRLVRVTPRLVFGTREAIEQVLAAHGWLITTACIERVNLSIRQHVAAVGRRVMTRCQGENGWRQQLALYRTYDNFCLPHARLRQPFPQAEPTNGTGSPRRWQPRTPAMAAGLTDHVWTLRQVLLFRVPPWPRAV